MNQENLRQIEQILGYHFDDTRLLDKAFCHSSEVDNRAQSNERLEFLGDAILGAIICQRLFKKFPMYLEGDLTKIKSALVSRRICAEISKNLALQQFLKVGKDMSNSSALSGSLAAGLLEAVIAAIYVDGGFEAANDFIGRNFDELIEQTNAKQTHGNFKSLLQQYAQERFSTTPVYELLDEKGPDHNKCFETEAVIADRHFPSAWGTNKKEAEQKAALNALVALGILTHALAEHA